MQNSLVGLLSSYDIFGKSIPGSVFFLGVISLLPPPSHERTQDGFELLAGLSPRTVVPILVAALLLGLIFGEGVHTLAVNLERLVGWVGGLTLSGAQFLQRHFPELHERTTVRPDYSELTRRQERNYDRLNSITNWCRRRYYGTTDAFRSHRRLFALECVSNYNDDPGRRGENDPKHIYERFQNEFNAVFDRDLPKEGIDDLVEIYPLVTSVVTASGGQQYRRFQSIYTFCRSMWVSLMLIAIGHGLHLYDPQFALSGTSTVGTTVFEQLSIEPVLLPVGLALSALLFIDAAGTYKGHYVDYLVAEFALHASREVDNRSTTESEQKRVGPDQT